MRKNKRAKKMGGIRSTGGIGNSGFLSLSCLLCFLSILCLPPRSHAQAQPVKCQTFTITGTGDTLLLDNTPGTGGSGFLMVAGQWKYTTTGAPTAVSIQINGVDVGFESNPWTVVPAATNTTGANMGVGAGIYDKWYAHVNTLSGGTNPSILLRSCFDATNFSKSGSGSAIPTNGTNGQVLTTDGGSPQALSWETVTGTGTVTSVGIASNFPWVSITGSPITGAGTININGTTGLAANQFLATPNGSTGSVGLRVLVGADLPNPTLTTAGGVESIDCTGNGHILKINTNGTVACSADAGAAVQSVFGRTGTVVAASNDYSVGQLSGLPVTVAQGGTGATTFSANVPLIGNGTNAITVGARSGNTTTFATTSGTLNAGDCAKFDASGNIVDNGAACGSGGGGSGTVNIGTANQVAYYAATGTTLSGDPHLTDNGTVIATNEGMSVAPTSSSQVGLAVNNPSGTSADIEDFQVNGATKAKVDNSGNGTFASVTTNGANSGSITFNGSTSGSATITVAAAAGTPNSLQLPTTTGTAGQVLSTDGGNPQQLSWINVGGSGTVTQVNTSPPLSGGPITTSGTISCPTCATGPGSSTNGDLASFNSTGGLALQDSGIPQANVVTASANFTNGDLVQAAGNNKTASDSGVVAANVVTATTAAAAPDQLCLSGAANKTCLYTDFPDVKDIPAANCVAGTPGSAWNYPSSSFTAACRTGTNNLGGVLQAAPNAATSATAQFMFELPKDWDTGTQPYVSIYYGSGSNTSGTVQWTVSSACVDVSTNGGSSDDPSFQAESAFTAQTMAAANRMWYQNGQFTRMTSANGCKAQSKVIIKVSLGGTASSNINVYEAILTIPRQLVVQAN